MSHPSEIRDSVFCHQGWYPSDPAKLRVEVESYLENVELHSTSGKLRALVAPHAGYAYSGQVAAEGYARLAGASIHRVIVLAPSHGHSYRGISIGPFSAYRTPLGTLPVDREGCKKLLSESLFTSVREAHLTEHSLEIQLPFLQTVLSEFKLIPLLVGRLDEEGVRRVAEAIHPLMNEETILIASSDFTHYGAAYGYLPFTNEVEENLTKLDLGAIAAITKGVPQGFMDYIQRTGATVCGYLPISIVMAAMEGNARAELIKYDTSGRLTGDFSMSVSYASICFEEKGAS